MSLGTYKHIFMEPTQKKW